MNVVTVSAVRQCGVPASNLTDDELISRVKAEYPRMGAMFSVVIQRYQEAVDRLEGRSPFESFTPDRVSCPHCGSALLLHSTNPQHLEHLDGN